jgi:hypothetical protein
MEPELPDIPGHVILDIAARTNAPNETEVSRRGLPIASGTCSGLMKNV